MEGAWFTGIADELARCLTDARVCAEACEALLDGTASLGGEDVRRRVADAVVAPAAVARVLIDLIDQPRQLVLAAATLCRDAGEEAIAVLQDLSGELVETAVAALRACVDSCAALLDAA
jgi:hypothetical protein